MSLIFDILLILFSLLVAYGLSAHQPLQIFLLFTPIISLSLALPISIDIRRTLPEDHNKHNLKWYNFLGKPHNVVVGLLGGVMYVLEGARGTSGK